MFKSLVLSAIGTVALVTAQQTATFLDLVDTLPAISK